VEVGDKELKNIRCRDLHQCLPLAVMNKEATCLYPLFSNEKHFSFDEVYSTGKFVYVMQIAKQEWIATKKC
jgi:hypothetical protein